VTQIFGYSLKMYIMRAADKSQYSSVTLWKRTVVHHWCKRFWEPRTSFSIALNKDKLKNA
jgi:hypothetical protein